MRNNKQNDPRQLTIREAYARLYDKSDLTRSTVRTDGYHCDTWEKFSENPPVSEVTNADLLQFKNALIESGLAPSSVNSKLAFLRKVFRVLCPQETGNPTGLGILERRPYTKPASKVRKQPKRVPLETLTRFYQACKHATAPNKFVRPVDWWRALIVTAYFTGLRRGDLFRMAHSQIDLEKGLLNFQAEKTDKFDAFPLHPATVNHLKRIWNPVSDRRIYLFQAYSYEGCSRFYSEWKSIFRESGLDKSEWFTLHDLRRTGASEIERVRPGLAPTFLQHSPRGVSEESYLNRSEELREAIFEMRIPTGFSCGVSIQERAESKAIETKQKIRPVDYLAPVRPAAELWRIEPGRWRFGNSEWFKIPQSRREVLELLAYSESPITIKQLSGVLWKNRDRPEAWKTSATSRLSELRKHLSDCLGLPGGFNCIPCVERGDGGAWTIYFPSELIDLHQGTTHKANLFAARSPSEFWKFDEKSYRYRDSKPFCTTRDMIDLIQRLATNDGVVSYFELAAEFYGDDSPFLKLTRNRVHCRITKLRERLRRDFELPNDFDPVPYCEAVGGGGWSIRLPV